MNQIVSVRAYYSSGLRRLWLQLEYVHVGLEHAHVVRGRYGPLLQISSDHPQADAPLI